MLLQNITLNKQSTFKTNQIQILPLKYASASLMTRSQLTVQLCKNKSIHSKCHVQFIESKFFLYIGIYIYIV